ncbi:alpha-L-rhamnosidase C-terminal domain-containing protein [Cohnella lupini]|uniref:alpha-L-rhamnosidase-related protein n=1 Tax=Cohnella lupini TaxID=1294267 RepID=UPI000E261369|nr:alpha-L-rhamnosidase C-terminal domain-containing protein [Cohnella lupini]
MEENRKWLAKWIWLDNEHATGTKQERVYARRTFQVTDPAEVDLTIDVSADSRYRLYLNGSWVSSGPCKGNGWNHYYEKIDLTPYLVPGINVIAAVVLHFPIVVNGNSGEVGPASVWRSDRGGLLVEGALIGKDGRIVEELHTNQAWKMKTDDAVSIRKETGTLFVGGTEEVDGGRLPHGWRLPGYNDSGWSRPDRIMDTHDLLYGGLTPWQLTPRTLPPLSETDKFVQRVIRSNLPGNREYSKQIGLSAEGLFPLVLPANSSGWAELDLGRMTVGYPIVSLSEGKGARLKLLYSEAYEYEQNDGKRNWQRRQVRDDPEGKVLLGNEDEYSVGGYGTRSKPEEYEPLAVRAGRFVRLSWSVADEPLEIGNLIWREVGYPLDVRASVQSSDPLWQPMWDISLNTLMRCMHDTYEDTPYYEQMQYVMDARLQALFTFQVSADDRLARKTIHDYHGSLLPTGMLQSRYPSVNAQIIPGFSLYWIMMVQDHYRYYGDAELVRQYRPTMDAILEWFERRVDNGLVGIMPEAYWSFVDWVEEWRERAGVPSAKWEGPMTIYNLMYVTALDSAAELNEITGRTDTAREYRSRADSIRIAAKQQCYDEEDGLFRDGPQSREFSQHAQIWAVLGGAVEGEEARRLMERALSHGSIARTSFSMTHFLFRALSVTGLYDRTAELWEPWKKQIDLHLTAWVEDPVQQRSDCHGWGALPLYEYTAETLGVQPEEPGYGTIRIRPRLSGLKWAKGEVATPRGMVKVDWSLNDDGNFHLRAEIPDDARALIVLPDGQRQLLERGGIYESSCKITV